MQMQVQPFEVSDFSGGITDNLLMGDPRRSARLQNFLITVDHKLETRPGYVKGLGITNDWFLPTGKTRVSNLFTVQDEKYLFGQSGRQVYYYDPLNSWTPVVGPTGNPAVQAGDIYNQTTVAEFQHTFYLASDGGNESEVGVQPSKIFKDKNNVWQAFTAGLPRYQGAPTFNNGNLLAQCITLANALRTTFIAHMSDVVPGNVYNKNNLLVGNPPNFDNIHAYLDKYSLSYFIPQSFNNNDAEIPVAIPTPAPAATDQASLFTLVGALNNSFSHHVADPQGAWGPTAGLPFYHWAFWYGTPSNSPYFTIYNIPKGPNVPPTNAGTPSVLPSAKDNSNALLTCATMLNDLYQKYNWHRLAVNTHGLNNDPIQIDKYRVPVGKIGAIGAGLTNVNLDGLTPSVLPDYGDLYNYVNNLKASYNTHVNSVQNTGLFGGGGFHKQADLSAPIPSNIGVNKNFSIMTSNLCRLNDCIDLDSMYLLIYWLRVLYGGLHIQDANGKTFIRTSMTTTAGSNTVTSLIRTDTNTTFTFFLNNGNMFIPGTIAPTGVTFSGPLVSFANGSASFQRNLNSSQSAVIGQASDSLYHASWSITANDVNTSSVAQEAAGSFIQSSLTSMGADVKSWLTLANEFFFAFCSHIAGTGNDNSQSHVWNSSAPAPGFAGIFAAPSPIKPFFIPEVSQVSYAFFWTHEYVVEQNGITFLTQGNPRFIGPLDIAISYPLGFSIPSQNTKFYPDANVLVTRGNTISGLPVLLNDNSTNYDTTNARMNIYRTTDGGTTWFLVAQVPNGTTSFVDTVNDTTTVGNSPPLDTKQQMYTTGGVAGFDQPPQCKFVHILNGTAYYGAVIDTGQFFPQRIRQSIPFAPDGAPATFFLDLDDELTGLSSTRANLIAFTKKGVYRVTGQFNQLGQGSMAAENISDGIGCLSAKSIIRTEIGVFFAGTDGFYYTDAFQVIKISLELDKTYLGLTLSLNQQKRIYGCFDKVNRRIWWNMMTTQNDTDNDITYIFYLNYGVKPSGVFTTANSSTPTVNSWRPSSMIFWNGVNIRGDERGYIFSASNDTKTDPKVDTTKDPSLWGTTVIPYEYRSLALDMGGTYQRQWVTKTHVVGKNAGNSSIQINAIRDLNADGQGIKPLAPINFTENIMWGTPNCIWNDPVVGPQTQWNNNGPMDLWRRLPRTSLRSDFFQVQMVPAKIGVYASSTYGMSTTVDNAAKTATLIRTIYTAVNWPLDVVDMVISFQNDGYVLEYPITAIANNVLTYLDSSNTSPLVTGIGTGWVIRGMRKEARTTVTSYLLNFIYYGDQVQGFPGKTTTSGPGNSGENPS